MPLRYPLKGLTAVALLMALTGCPALLSDDFRIVPDAQPPSDAGASDGALFDAFGTARKDDDAANEAWRDDVGVAADVAIETDTGSEGTAAAEGASEGAIEADAPSTATDGPPEAASDAANETSQCTPIATTPFGCGSTGYQFPTQYCVYRSGTNGNPDTTVGMPTPTACRCTGGYTCSCLVALGQVLCPPDTPTYINCQTGTTGGVVVGCR